ncbi:PAS domain S-box protein [Chondromyces apiculatus]|uniref:RsbR, positive regulator of sigma-B n=1 Tax=Chondromyces apiculatus DSM 436 TaxID=1192034 RepID=A0A017T551_9BACT|nr:PAS domain S-box protein [Chondromyces apiculatus]EYF03940.1 RsbR, positive regulator of sigma-B [Chondromyces apiculatus DSM 436]
MNSEQVMGDAQARIAALEAENARLRARVEEIERGLLPEVAQGTRAGSAREMVEGVSYEAIFQALPIPFAIYRSDGLIVACNEAHCGSFGRKRVDVEGKVNIFALKQSAQNGYRALLERAFAGEVVRGPATPFTADDGSRLWREATLAPIDDGAGGRLVVAHSFDVTTQKEAEEQQQRMAALLRAVIHNAPMPICVRDLEGRHVVMNEMNAKVMSMDAAYMLGKTLDEIMPGASAEAEAVRKLDQACLDSREPILGEHHWEEADGEHVYFSTTFPVIDETYGPLGTCAISTDITARVRVEERNRKLQEEMLQIQRETLEAISTPLIPIAKGVVVMPLVGEMTRERAARALETLLHGISGQQARIAILDVTGVPEAGLEVTEAILMAARSVRLLGAEVVLTGIRPSVAQSLVEGGADLGGIVTLGTLERGVAYALAAQGPTRRRGG